MAGRATDTRPRKGKEVHRLRSGFNLLAASNLAAVNPLKPENADMTNAIQITFDFISHTLRVVMRDGEPWFVAADVCAALAIGDTSQACGRLDDDEKGTYSIRTPGGDQQMTVINESGLYSLILGSRKPESKKFKKWVTSEVLPAIRKTGRYEAPIQPQATVPEYLSASEEQSLTRLAWLISNRMPFSSSVAHAFWYRLRQVTGTVPPAKFEVRHLPVMAAEITRIFAAVEAFHEVQHQAARTLTKRILRKADDAHPVIAEITQAFEAVCAETDTELQRRISPWSAREISALAQSRLAAQG